VGERVQAYTHPLWFLLLSFLTLITGSVYFSVFFASISLSILNIWLLIQRISTSLMGCLIAVVILLFSHALVDYSTSGLENLLAHFFTLFICYYAFEFIKNPTQKLLTSFSLALSFLFLTRQDLVLCFLPLAMYIFYQAKKEGLHYRLSIILGLIPALGWTVFSIFYYGFPFPNTAYAKLGTGIDAISLVLQGRYYFIDSMRSDPITLMAILTGLFISIRAAVSVKTIGLGVLLYLMYILYIGGDFMSGRFFTVPLLLMCIVISRTNFFSKPLWCWMVALIAVAFFYRPIAIWSEGGNYPGFPSAKPYQSNHGISDERSMYYKWYNIPNWIIGSPEFDYPTQWKVGKENRLQVMCNAYEGVRHGPDLHLVDPCGLSDPLLARLPALKKREWRIGHFFREIPEGYLDLIQSRENQISDPATRDFYSAIKLVTQGPLLSWERLKTVTKINLNLLPKPNQYLYQYGPAIEASLNSEAIRFSRAGLTSQGLGWQTHEEWGVWSNGSSARLVFKLSNPETKSLQLKLRALVGGPIQCQQLSIEINLKKRLSECLSSTDNNVINIPLTKSDRIARDLLVIDFSLPNAASPKSIGLSSVDDRVLAIGLQEAIFQ